MNKIYLSPPHLSGEELENVTDVFASNWIAPLGPHVDAFEREFSETINVGHAAAVSSGTAALHLALILLGVNSDDKVLCSTLTFAASAFPIRYVGAQPIFVDSTEKSWNVDPDLVEDALKAMSRVGERPKAAVFVDLYGQSADWDRLRAVCEDFGVPIIEDAAEALGASYKDQPVGGFGRMGVFSFNGNKIITTSGGGMLVSEDTGLVEKARFLSTQARDSAAHYEHSQIGYNYRMSNILAAVGRGQLRVLQDRVAARRENFDLYVNLLKDLPGLTFMPETDSGRCTRWLTCITIDPKKAGVTREEVRQALEASNIESRPVWKPMHLQPVFKGCRVYGGAVAETLFQNGLCLPSGSALSPEEIKEISQIVANQWPCKC